MQRYYGNSLKPSEENNGKIHSYTSDTPHIYRTADIAYRSMLKATSSNSWDVDSSSLGNGNVADQSILVSGER